MSTLAEARLRAILKGVTEAAGATGEVVRYERFAPATINNAALTREAAPSLERAVGKQHLSVIPPSMASEDFSFFANDVPGFFYRLGQVKAGTTSGDHHTPTFLADDSTIPVGIKAMSVVVLDYLTRHNNGAPMLTVTKDLVLPATITGSWPRPRWFDMSMWGRPLDTCMMDTRYREQFGDALSTVIADQERAGLDIVTHGDLHCDDDMAGRSWHHYPLQRWAGFEGDYLQSEETRSPWLRYPPGTLLNEIYTGWRWPRVVDKIVHRPLDYPKIWRLAQARAAQPVKFGTCCSQVMGLFLDIHTPKYTDHRQVIWDMAEAMNKELLALRDGGCKVIQIEEPTLHFWANTYGAKSDEVKFMVEAFNREVQGLDDVELWIHTCWGNPEHAAGDRGRQLQGVVRSVSRRRSRGTSGPSR